MKNIPTFEAAVIGAIILIWIGGGAATAISSSAVKQAATGQLVAQARRAVNGFDQAVGSSMNELREWATAAAVIKAMSASNLAFERIRPRDVYIEGKDIEWITAPPDDLTPLMRGILNNSMSLLLRSWITAREGADSRQPIRAASATNRFGVNVAMTTRTDDYRQDDEDWWRTTRDNGWYFHLQQSEPVTDAAFADVAVRVDDADGAFTGVIRATLELPEMASLLPPPQAIGDGTDAVPVMSVLTPAFNLIWTQGEWGDGEFPSNLREHVMGAREGTVVYNHAHAGRRGIAFARGSADSGGDPSWIVVLDYDVDAVLRPARRCRSQSIALLCVISVAVLSLAMAGRKIGIDRTTAPDGIDEAPAGTAADTALPPLSHDRGSVTDWIADTIAVTRPMARNNGNRFTVDVTGVPGDAARMAPCFQRLVMKVLDNAARFARNGDVHIRVRYDDDERRLRIRVADSGIGMPPPFVEQLNLHTAAVHATHPASTLYSILHDCRQSGGTVEVYSRVNQGTAFDITVPIAGDNPVRNPASTGMVEDAPDATRATVGARSQPLAAAAVLNQAKIACRSFVVKPGETRGQS